MVQVYVRVHTHTPSYTLSHTPSHIHTDGLHVPQVQLDTGDHKVGVIVLYFACGIFVVVTVAVVVVVVVVVVYLC